MNELTDKYRISNSYRVLSLSDLPTEYLEDQLRIVKNKLETDDRMQPISWEETKNLIISRDNIINELNKRTLTQEE